MTPPALRPGAPPVIDADGNLWIAAYDARTPPACIHADVLRTWATVPVGNTLDFDHLHGALRVLAALLGVRPIPEAREVRTIAGSAGVAHGLRERPGFVAGTPVDVTEAEVSAACRFFGEACADSMGYRGPIRRALEAFVRGRAKR